MKYSGNLKENLIKMRQYFVNEFGFVCIDGENLYEDETIECELYLIQNELDIKIFIVKHFDDDEIDFTISGRPIIADKYSEYIVYFLDPKNIDTWCSKNVVDELDEYFKGNK